jgi:hypothetical protein
MDGPFTDAIGRRSFLKLAGASLASTATNPAHPSQTAIREVAVVIDPNDSLAGAPPVLAAIRQLRKALAQKGGEVPRQTEGVHSAEFALLIASPQSHLIEALSTGKLPSTPETFRITPIHTKGKPALCISGSDILGLTYAVLEIADRVQFSSDLASALDIPSVLEESPINRVRSIARSYVSEVEDRSWFYDRAFWPNYLDMLVANRFNRFALTFGLNYDYPKGVTEDYFHFLYPYLFDVPGYNVQVRPSLAPGEQKRNLETIQYIAQQTAQRGLQFQLGLWSHGYVWVDSPNAQHSIEGLTPQTHPAYCRDALALLLKECPEITGLTFRIHEESGIPQGEYNFWGTLFDSVKHCGRQIELDLHAKSLKQPLMDVAVTTGQPLKVSPKFAAEHVAFGYHQAAIRDLEMPKTYAISRSGKFDLGNEIRGFLRYGYGDLIQQGRPYEMLYRVWPGTQRHLLWGDPGMAAGWSRASGFCGGAGMEFFEPLAFKGREGSGVPGGRNAYADPTLEPEGADWRKFEYTYRVLGRSLYNPRIPIDIWHRYLRRDFGPGAEQVQIALSEASRLMPTVVQAYLPSAANQWYWPELYTHMQLVPGNPAPYYDSPEPLSFGTVDPIDPQLFTTAVEHARELLSGKPSGKYTQLEAAIWLEASATRSAETLDAARKLVPNPTSPAFRRLEEDVLIQNSLGLFFAAKFRAGLLYEICQQTGDVAAGQLSIAQLRKAREIWAAMAQRATMVYRPNIAYGDKFDRRGHWMDRLAAIDDDLKAMEAKLDTAKHIEAMRDASHTLATLGKPLQRVSVTCTHRPPSSFQAGQPLEVTLDLSSVSRPDRPTAITLYYRHVNQAEHWKSIEATVSSSSYAATIPGEYTESPFPLQYYWRLRRTSAAWLYPAIDASFSAQPYFVVQRM